MHRSHGVVDTFDAAVTTRGVGACRELMYTEEKGVHPNHFGVHSKPMASIFAIDTFDAAVPLGK